MRTEMSNRVNCGNPKGSVPMAIRSQAVVGFDATEGSETRGRVPTVMPHQRPALVLRDDEIVHAPSKVGELVLQRRFGSHSVTSHNVRGERHTSPLGLVQKPVTRSALPHPAKDIGVLRTVLMPVWAMGLGPLVRSVVRQVASRHVLGMRDGVHVVRPDASPVAAQVVNLPAGGHGPIGPLEVPAMCGDVAPGAVSTAADAKDAVAVAGRRAGPKPAIRSLADVPHKPVDDRACWCVGHAGLPLVA